MADPRFFKTAGPFSVGALADLTGTEIVGAGARDLMLEGVAALETAGPRQLSFLSNMRYADAFAASRAGAAFVHPAVVQKAPPAMTLLVSPKPYLAFAKAAQAFHPTERQSGIAATAAIDPGAVLGEEVFVGHHAVIEAGAEIGPRTQIGPNSVIGAGCVIGADCRIGANVTVSHCLMGDRVTLYPGVCIGQDGFGFAADAGGHVKIPQLGRVLIEDDVEIGANSTVDRGAGPDTVVGAGSMIDNLIQIAHNVVLGRGCIMAAQSGIAGSTKLGDFVMVGAQAGMIGHLTIGDGAKIGGKAGVMRDVPAGGAVGGTPAVPMMQWLRHTAILDRLANKKDK